MAATGPKPKEQKVSRTPNVLDWVEVPDVPYSGDGAPPLGRAPAATKRWWEVLTTMPHCVLWRPGDWQFALDTARLHAAFSRGDMARAQEIRVREKLMGTTIDARRDLRIRYVAPAEEPTANEGDARIANFEDERRRRLLDAD